MTLIILNLNLVFFKARPAIKLLACFVYFTFALCHVILIIICHVLTACANCLFNIVCILNEMSAVNLLSSMLKSHVFIMVSYQAMEQHS